jgi:uncharacterized membrane protein
VRKGAAKEIVMSGKKSGFRLGGRTGAGRWAGRKLGRAKKAEAQEKHSEIERELSILEKIELGAKFAAASIPLTYISGYLIATSYLGTYGLHLSSSDLFRAKYIYIGFEYLMFLVLVIATFRVGMRIIELSAMVLKKTSPDVLEMFKRDKILALNVLDSRNKTLVSRSRRKFQDLRGDFVVGLIVLVFTIEIMFLNPENLGGILPRQILYLLGVAIYQCTFYGELHEPYARGLVYGRRYIEDLRWLLLNAQAAAATSILCRIAVNVMKTSNVSGAWFWFVYGFGWLSIAAAVEIEVLGAISICARKERLSEIDKHDRFDPVKWESDPNVGTEILKSLFRFRALIGAWVGYFMPCSSRHPLRFRIRRASYLLSVLVLALFLFLLDLYNRPLPGMNMIIVGAPLRFWANLLIVGAPLPLSLLVMSNVGVLSALVSRRARRLGYNEKSGEDELSDKQVLAKERERAKWERYARRAIMAAVLYVSSVLSFGYIVYPHIPVQKAGGNYDAFGTNQVCVSLTNETALQGCPRTLLPALKSNEAFVPLEEDSDWVYLAGDQDARGPHCWSWAGIEEGYCRPRVYAVNRKCIAGIVDALPKSAANRCP